MTDVLHAKAPHFQSSSPRTRGSSTPEMLELNREAAAYWIVRSSPTMTVLCGEANATHLPWRALGQNPLQGAAMHVQPPRGFRDVAVAHLVDALDVLPAHPVGRHRILRRLRFLGAAGEQGC